MRKTRSEALTPSEYRNRAVRLCDGAQPKTEKEPSEPDRSENDGDVTEESTGGGKGRRPERTARSDAMALVSAASYTEQALRRKLESRERYGKEEIDGAIEYVKGFGYVNDRRLAENAVYKLSKRLWGKRKICFYLNQKGISEDITETLDFSEIDFTESCETLMRKYDGKPIEKAMRAAYNAGFTHEEISQARKRIELDG